MKTKTVIMKTIVLAPTEIQGDDYEYSGGISGDGLLQRISE